MPSTSTTITTTIVLVLPDFPEVNVGSTDGADVGGMDGAEVGGMDGAEVGGMDGADVGGMDGADVGEMDGVDGDLVGDRVGALVRAISNCC